MNQSPSKSQTYWLPLEPFAGLYVLASDWHRIDSEPIAEEELNDHIAKYYQTITASVKIKDRLINTTIHIPSKIDDYAYVLVDVNGAPCDSASEAEEVVQSDDLIDYLDIVREKWAFSESLGPKHKAYLWTEFLHRSLVIKSPKGIERQLTDWRKICEGGRVLLVGAAGSGKTTLLRRLTIELADEKARDETDTLLPVYVQLRNWTHTNSTTRLVMRELASCSIVSKNGKLEDLLADGRVVFLFDGFDEVASEVRTRAADDLKNFMKRYSNARFLITARPGSYLRALPGELEHCEFVPWNHDQIAELCWHKLNENSLSWKSFWYRLKSEQDILELGQNPLLLSMLLSRYTLNGLSPHFTTEAITAVTDTLTRDWDSARGVIRGLDSRFSPELKLGLLKRIGGYLYDSTKSRLSLEDCALLMESMQLQYAPKQLMDVLEEETGLIHQVEQDCWQFLHRSILDYFAASYHVDKTTETILAERPKEIADRIWQFICFFASDVTQLLSPRLEEAIDITKAIQFVRMFSQNLLVEKSTVNGVGLYVMRVLEAVLEEFDFVGNYKEKNKTILEWKSSTAKNQVIDNTHTICNLIEAIYNARDGVANSDILSHIANSKTQGLKELAKAFSINGQIFTDVIRSNSSEQLRVTVLSIEDEK